MIASSATLFAVLATIAAGQHFTVLPNAVSRDQAIAACANAGLQLAAITASSIAQVSAQLPGNTFGWVASWEGNNYQGACLLLKAGTITAAGSCAEQHLPVCEGMVHPHVPSSSSSSSSSSIPVPSSSICESSSSESSSWSCDNSSSSFGCSSDLSSDLCSNSSSSSSSDNCDPCCAGVQKLTYQAPFGAGAYLAKVSQKFSVFDVFGTNACANVHSLAATLGVYATLVGSDGLDACGTQSIAAATAAQTAANTVNTQLGVVSAALTVGAQQTAAATLLTYAQALLVAAVAAQTANSDLASGVYADALVADAQAIIAQTTAYILTLSTSIVVVSVPAGLTAAVTSAVTDSGLLVTSVTAAAAYPFGTYYTVSRAWALNQPIYALLNGVVSAANSLYNCYGEYRAIYLAKSLSDLTFVGNNSGNVCFDRCHGKPQSCLALCNGLQRPGYLPRFKIGA